MASRFGRKKRRQAREAIERLSSDNESLTRMVRHAEYRAANARQEALDVFVKDTDLYKAVFAECGYSLGKALGKELNQHTDKLLSLVVREPLRFSYHFDHMTASRELNVVEVRIPLKDLCIRKVVA